MKTIAFLNMKGGVAKTTTSVNVAVGLAMKGKRVLLVDFDPQSNSTSMFVKIKGDNNEPFKGLDHTISSVLTGDCTIEDAIIKIDENLSLVPSGLELSNTEMALRMQSDIPQHNRLQKALKKVQSKFDYCIIDCPPAITLLTVNVILTSDRIIIPIKPDEFAVYGYDVTTRNIDKIKAGWELEVDYKVLFTIVNRNNEEREIIERVKRDSGGRYYNTTIRSQPKPIAGASKRKVPVIKDKSPKTGVAADLRAFVDELVEEME